MRHTCQHLEDGDASLSSAASLTTSSLLCLSLCLSPYVVFDVVFCVLCVSVCVSVFLVVFGASAMKVNAWTCAPATASGLDSAWRSINISVSLQRVPQNNWSSTASPGEENDWRNREHVVLDRFSKLENGKDPRVSLVNL